jgi:hypothetical protein
MTCHVIAPMIRKVRHCSRYRSLLKILQPCLAFIFATLLMWIARVESYSVLLLISLMLTLTDGLSLSSSPICPCKSQYSLRMVPCRKGRQTGICTPDPVWYLPATHHVQLASATRPIPVWYLPGLHHVQLPSSVRPVPCWSELFARTT